MATFNGAAYVQDQLESILEDLLRGDEVVVVDDCSSDDTASVVRGIDDPRLRVVVLEKNVGHVAAFERAISEATSETIMLADQDDLWVPGRVEAFVRALQSADLAVGAYETFGRGNATSSVSRLGSEYPGSLRNLVMMVVGRRPYSGCVMAFRSTLLPRLLPFPTFLEAHDHWLGIVGNVNAETVHVLHTVTLRRLHASNVTPNKRRGILRVLKTRWIYAQMVAEAWRRRVLSSG